MHLRHNQDAEEKKTIKSTRNQVICALSDKKMR